MSFKKPDDRYAVIAITYETDEISKVYVDVTKNVSKYFDTIQDKLKEGSAFPSSMRKDLKTYGTEKFTIDVLEYLSEIKNKTLLLKRNKYIDEFNSLDKEYGYNVKADYYVEKEIEGQEVWTTKDSEKLEAMINEAKKSMNINFEYSDDRMEIVREFFDSDLVVKYLSTGYYRGKQLKNKNDFLCETESISKDLQVLAYYLMLPRFKNEEHREDFIMDETGTVLSNHLENNVTNYDYSDKAIKKQCPYSIISNSRYKKDYSRELTIFDDTRERRKKFDNIDLEKQLEESRLNIRKPKYARRDKKTNKKFTVETSIKVTKEDIERFPPLRSMDDSLKEVARLTGIGGVKSLTPTQLRERYEDLCKGKSSEHPLVKNGFEKYVAKLKFYYCDVKGDMPHVKRALVRPIDFKNLMKSSGIFDYDYTVMNFTDVTQVRELLLNMKELRDRHHDKLNDMWANIYVLDELIKKIDFSDIELEVIRRLNNYEEISEIINALTPLYDLSSVSIRKTIDEKIPKKIVEQYKQDKEDWIYTEIIKGNYKICTKCKEVRLANNKYFGKDTRNRDNLKGICKKCDKKGKKQ